MNRLLVLLVMLASAASAQSSGFRSGIFLHHSTGGCIWGPNGSTTSVPLEIASYNTAHGFSAGNTVSLGEIGWPVTPWDNEWYRWHNIFDNRDTVDADIRPILNKNRIVIIKSCFPSSAMTGWGNAADTVQPTRKTIFNYKWHWRSIVRAMRTQPGNFFVLWTNAPLVASATSDQAALLSHQFCIWARDTLAEGRDPMLGDFPKNVHVFDFFHALVGADWKLPVQYAASSGDSHPNAAATALVAPQFVQEVFDAAIAYEGTTAVRHQPSRTALGSILLQNYPNPFNGMTRFTIRVDSPAGPVSRCRLEITDVLGRAVAEIFDGEVSHGETTITWNASGVASGVYVARLLGTPTPLTQKLLLSR